MSIEVVTSPQDSSKFLMHFLISASYTFEKGIQWMNILLITRSLVDFASCVLRELACVCVFASHHHLEVIGPSDSKAEKQIGWLGFPGCVTQPGGTTCFPPKHHLLQSSLSSCQLALFSFFEERVKLEKKLLDKGRSKKRVKKSERKTTEENIKHLNFTFWTLSS